MLQINTKENACIARGKQIIREKTKGKAGGEQQMKKNLIIKNSISNIKLNDKTENKDKYA